MRQSKHELAQFAERWEAEVAVPTVRLYAIVK